jgi:hypothetical protein
MAKIEAFFDGYKDEGGESVRRGGGNQRLAAFCAAPVLRSLS